MAGRAVPMAKEPEAEVKLPVEVVALRDAQHFEVRTITPQNWAKLGIEDGPLIHWHVGNNFRVPRSDFDFLDEDQFSRYILADNRLEVVTED